MITFIISLAVLILGYLFYGRFVERVFGPDDRVTPAEAPCLFTLRQRYCI